MLSCYSEVHFDAVHAASLGKRRTKRIDSSSNASELYSRSAWVHISAATPTIHVDILVVFLSPSWQMPGEYHELGHGRFLPLSVQCSILRHPVIPSRTLWVTDSVFLLYKVIVKSIWTYGIQVCRCEKSCNIPSIQRFQSKTPRALVKDEIRRLFHDLS
jgi:hypothetical protein